MIVRRLFYVALAIAVFLLGFAVFTLSQVRGEWQDTPPNHAFGTASANLTVVGFFDYDCIHCRSIEPSLIDAVEKDGNVRLIPRLIVPVNSKSGYNVKLTYAAGMQNKFREAFRYTMEHYKPMDENDVESFAQAIGADAEQLRSDAQSPAVDSLMKKSQNVFYMLGAKSTPIFFFGRNKQPFVAPKILTADEFIAVFNMMRGQG